MVKTKGAGDSRPGRRKRRCYTDREKAQRKAARDKKKADLNKKSNHSLNEFYKPNGNQDGHATTDPAEDAVDMLDVDEDDIEEPPIVITISARYGNGAVERSDIAANLDIDEDNMEDEDEDDDPAKKKSAAKTEEGGVQQRYMKAVHDRLRVEMNNKPTKELQDYWLKTYLKDNDWWIRKEEATKVCKKLEMRTDEIGLPAYYKSIKVWTPEEMWGIDAMPFCPTCKNNQLFSNHLKQCYCISTKSYIAKRGMVL